MIAWFWRSEFVNWTTSTYAILEARLDDALALFTHFPIIYKTYLVVLVVVLHSLFLNVTIQVVAVLRVSCNPRTSRYVDGVGYGWPNPSSATSLMSHCTALGRKHGFFKEIIYISISKSSLLSQLLVF